MSSTLTAPPASRPFSLDTIRTRLGERATTTPGRLRVASLALVVGLIVLWIVAATALTARQHAARSVGLDSEPLLFGTEGVYGSLADADATAANTFLSGGLATKAQLDHYSEDIRMATLDLATVSHEVGPSFKAQAATTIITQQLPVYTGLVEAATVNNRQGLPVGAAYLRQASTLMRTLILPRADLVYTVEAGRLNNRYRSGTSPIGLVILIVIGAAVVGGLLVTQLYLARRTNRMINVPLLVATVLTLALTVWIIAGFAIEQHRLSTARSHGSNAVQVLSQARALALRAQSDQSLALVARGTGGQYIADFKLATGALGGSDGTTGRLGLAAGLPEPSVAATAIDIARAPYVEYLKLHDEITAPAVNPKDAITLATGKATDDFNAIDNDLKTAISLNQQRFEAKARSARHVLGAPSLAIPIFIVVAGLLCLFGLQQRINEYR